MKLSKTASRVWPSGAALATASVPGMPPAPARLSMTMDCPSASESCGAIARAAMSVTPPGEAGTTIRMGREGYCCALAAAASTQQRRKTEAGRRKAAPSFITRHPSRFMTLAGALVERFEEFSGELLRHAVDQARADLRELAADRGLGGVGEPGGFALGGQRNSRFALGEASDTALAFEREGVLARRIRVGHRHLALELGADRADFGRQHDVVFVVRCALDRFAARDAVLEHRRIVERLPGLGLRQRDQLLACHLHSFIPCGWICEAAIVLHCRSRICRALATIICGL